MITPKELLTKSEKFFFKIVSAQLRGENNFPLIIPSNKQIGGTNFSDWKNDLIPLYQNSKAVKSKGYSVDWKEKNINGSKQSIPTRIYFESLRDFLYFIGREDEYQKIHASRQLLLDKFPLLYEWAASNPSILLEYYDQWDDIIKVCEYFFYHPPPHPFYIRELPIEVHSKFIEQNVSILKKLLDILLPESWKNLNDMGFESRYFIRKANIYTQIRILDDSLKSILGYDECSLSLEDAAWLKWLPEKVFIIENKTCFLTFPKLKNAVAIFGEGFKSRISQHIPWLEQTNLYCWFDLDAAGFEMLNMIRQVYPTSKSFLMDRDTYMQFENFSHNVFQRAKQLSLLTNDEQQVYQFLVSQNRRLEQEHVSHLYVCTNLNALS
jgi:hypothetical protein